MKPNNPFDVTHIVISPISKYKHNYVREKRFYKRLNEERRLYYTHMVLRHTLMQDIAQCISKYISCLYRTFIDKYIPEIFTERITKAKLISSVVNHNHWIPITSRNIEDAFIDRLDVEEGHCDIEDILKDEALKDLRINPFDIKDIKKSIPIVLESI